MPVKTITERAAALRAVAERMSVQQENYRVNLLDMCAISEAGEILERLADQVDEPPTGRRWSAR